MYRFLPIPSNAGGKILADLGLVVIYPDGTKPGCWVRVSKTRGEGDSIHFPGNKAIMGEEGLTGLTGVAAPFFSLPIKEHIILSRQTYEC